MNKTYGVNMADKHLVVNSIEVLNEIRGPGMKALQNKIDAINQSQQFAPKPVDYWSELSSDGIITPFEKKTLKSQWEQIESVYTSLSEEAVLQEKTQDETWVSYTAAYNALHNYLYLTLKIFDNMQKNTTVEREDFDSYYTLYYTMQSNAQMLLTQGTPGRIRNLSSLNETGYEGEVAIYNNWFYTYESGAWQSVPNDLYKGYLTELPAKAAEGQFFLADGVFDLGKSNLILNGKRLLCGGKRLVILRKTQKGNIYYRTANAWKEDTDRNSWRYLVATNDLITTNSPISENIANLIKIESGVNGYLGMFVTDPATPPFNSYYVYIGDNTATRTNGNIYIYRYEGWKELNPRDKDSYSYYMHVLSDTLQNNSIQTGAFSGLFASYLAANQAFIDSLVANQALITQLFSKQITLLQGGTIQSENYGQIVQLVFAEYKIYYTKSGSNLYNTEYLNSMDQARAAANAAGATQLIGVQLRFKDDQGNILRETAPTHALGFYIAYMTSNTETPEDADYIGFDVNSVDITLKSGRYLWLKQSTGGGNFYVYNFMLYDRYGFRQAANGDIQSANFDEQELQGYKLGKDGRIISNKMKAYDMQAEGGTFTDIKAKGGTFTDIKAVNGFFSGVIDCEKFKIEKQDLSIIEINLLKDDIDAWSDFNNMVRELAYPGDTITNSNFGSGRKIYVYNKDFENSIELISLTVWGNRAGGMTGKDMSGNIYDLYQYSAFTGFTSNLRVIYEQQESIVVKMIDLPETDPMIKGMLWNNNNVLNISLGN